MQRTAGFALFHYNGLSPIIQIKMFLMVPLLIPLLVSLLVSFLFPLLFPHFAVDHSGKF